MNRLLILLMVLATSHVFAQHEYDRWVFGNGAYLDFNGGAPVAETGSVMNQQEGCSSIADSATGRLLFYTDGMTVWDSTHSVMPNGTGLYGHWSASQSALIVRQPGGANQFYIFTTDETLSSARGANYSVVDMNLNGGLGDVTTMNQNLWPCATEQVAAVKHVNGVDVWVMFHDCVDSTFVSYLLTAGGLAGPYAQTIGVGEPTNHGFGYMKFSSDGTKLVRITQNREFELLKFNPNTGVLSDPLNFNLGIYNYGAEFSPSGNYLYICRFNPSDELQQFDISVWDSLTIASSAYIMPATGFTGAIQLAPDGKIYVLDDAFSNYLAAVNNPDIPGAGCNYSDSVAYLGTGIATLGLPGMTMEGTTVPCPPPFSAFTSTWVSGDFQFYDLSTAGTTSWEWDFGDGNSSTLPNPSHTYTASGYYNVCLVVDNGCDTDTACKTIEVCLLPQAGFTYNTLVDSVEFTYTGITADSYYWDFGDGDTSVLQNPTHTYDSVAAFVVCLVATDTCGTDTVCDTIVISSLVGVSTFFANHTVTWLSESNELLVSHPETVLTIELVDITGRLVYAISNVSGNRYPVGNIPKGVYLVRGVTTSGEFSGKVLVR